MRPYPAKGGYSMDQVSNSGLSKRREYSKRYIPQTPEEDFVSHIYHSVDDAAGRELLLLRNRNGIIPTCKRGCDECCKQFILINRAEAHALGQFIRREFSAGEINGLMLRTRQWHEWNDTRPGRDPFISVQHPASSSGHRPFCPLLIQGSCSVYSMRPITCRTHFVCSDPAFCRFSEKPSGLENGPRSLPTVVTATNLFSKRLNDSIKKLGSDSACEIMLLPHWLAIEMCWDFALTI